MKLPVAVRRTAYRVAWVGLQVYSYVRRPQMRGAKCLLSDGDLVLLVQHTYGSRKWDLPGGALKRHETPVEAARREVHEELGVLIEDWTALGELRVAQSGRDDTIHCFQAEVRAPQLAVNEAEIATTRWFPRADLPSELARFVAPILARAR
jgi:8-oxo-dGTP pyrophosphatase MutT (NUDIX family)